MADLQQTTPADPNAGWEDVPNAAAPQGSPTTDDGWEDVPAPQTYMQGVNHSSGEVLKGMGKQVASDLLDTNPLTGGLMRMDTHVGAIEALKGDLKSQNGAQSAGKFTTGAAEVLGGGVAEGIDSLVSKAKNLISDAAATEGLHNSIKSVAQKAADEAGVKITMPESVRHPLSTVADAIEAKATKKLDDLSKVFSELNPTRNFTRDPFGTGRMTKGTASALDMVGDYNALPKKIEQLQAKAASLIGPQNAEKRAAVLEELASVQKNKQVADKMLDNQGLQGAREEADRLFQQADDLRKVSKSLNQHTTGLKPSMLKSGVTGSAERVNGATLGPALENHYANGTLQSALGGEDNAHAIINSTNTTGRIQKAVAGRQQVAKSIVKGGAKLAVGGSIVDGVVHALGH